MVWSYEFSIRGYDNSRKKGTTNDPIAEFRNYYRDDEIQDMYEAAVWDASQKQKTHQYDVTQQGYQLHSILISYIDSIFS